MEDPLTLTGDTVLTAEGNLGEIVGETVQAEYSPTPKVLCHGRKEAERLERILEKIRQGDPITQIIRMGSIVYVHLEDENIG